MTNSLVFLSEGAELENRGASIVEMTKSVTSRSTSGLGQFIFFDANYFLSHAPIIELNSSMFKGNNVT